MSKHGGGARDDAEPVSATTQLQSLSMALAGIRRRLADGTPPERSVLDRVAGSLAAHPSAGERDSATAGAMIVLMDEIVGLVGQLEHERDAVRQRIRAWGQHQRAHSTYAARRPSR